MKKKKLGVQRQQSKSLAAEDFQTKEVIAAPAPELESQPVATKIREQKTGRYIPLAIRRAVWERDQGCCAYVRLNKKCGSKVRLELDHLKAFAKGGQHTIENLRLVCRQHNSQAAIQQFGRDTMSRWIKS